MSEINLESKLRKEACQKMCVFMANPGRFCLLVFGGRGVGKHFSIEYIFKKIKDETNKNLCLTDLVFIDSRFFPGEKEKINDLFKEHQNKTIVIEDVEDLTDEQQTLLFEALSTENGQFGIGEKFDIRIIFTSSKDIDTLRSDKELLQGYFFDRISQLVVKLPSYKDESDWITKDFQVTWEKMKFENIEAYKHFSHVPKNTKFEKFLEDNADKFDGGFRDLDKIACLYFNYRIFHYGDAKKIDEQIENKIADNVKDDFLTKSQLLASSDNDLNTFQFEHLPYKEIEAKYRVQLRRWAKKEWGTFQKAEQKLGMRPGTLKNYAENKVTKQRKNSNPPA
jgi:DNA-binding NtrC family response regulator